MKRQIVLQGDLSEEQAAEMGGCSEISVDCEMMGLHPWRDRLCVVQLMGEKMAPVLVQVDEAAGAPRLKQLLENPEIIVIFHFARMDLLFLHQRLGIAVTNVYCTKIASRLARTYTDRHSLKEVVREMVGDHMDKTSQSSDWGRAKLTDDQIQYAADDVRYLFEVKRKLSEILKREGRMELAQKAFDFLKTRRELDQLGHDDIFTH